MKKYFFIFLAMAIFFSLPGYSKKWTGTVLKDFDDSDLWTELVAKMKDAKMNYGAVAGSQRMLDYFSDLKSKEFAYRSIVELIDFGYPYSLRNVFMSGDLELFGKESFNQSYNLYKASVDLDKNMPKWANNYFNRVDKENFPKYLFYQALNEFNKKNLDSSLIHLDKALNGLTDPAQLSLSKKVSRTMARIYYEQNRYKESFDIYENYLLKLNPIEPSDWVEAAWNLYRLGRFDEALGYLYNLEIPDPDQSVMMEKYIIRALIYREKCATAYTYRLGASFEKEFGPTIEKVKLGEGLSTLPLIKGIVDRNSDYRRVVKTIDELQREKKAISALPSKLRKVASYLYDTEIKQQEKSRQAYEDLALNEAARRLVIMGESLRFLQFDVIREKYNPDKVFVPPPPVENLVETLPDNKFLLHWLQWGDYWRDERVHYRGLLKSWCQ